MSKETYRRRTGRRSTRIVTGFWRCPYCNTENEGNVEVCSSCGYSRGIGVKFYYDPASKSVVGDGSQISKKPDWVCHVCGGYNSSSQVICNDCGNPRTADDGDYFKSDGRIPPKEANKSDHGWFCPSCRSMNSHDLFTCASCGATRAPTCESCVTTEEPTCESCVTTEKPKCELPELNFNQSSSIGENMNSDERSHMKWPRITEYIELLGLITGFLKVLFFVFTIGIVIFGIIKLLSPKTEIMIIEQVAWEYSVDIERYQAVEKNSWNLPADARLLRMEDEVHHVKEEVDHYEYKTTIVTDRVFSHNETVTEVVERENVVGIETEVVDRIDLGNGYFEEIIEEFEIVEIEEEVIEYEVPIYEIVYEEKKYTEPVYTDVPVMQTKFYYEVDEWVFNRTVKSSGKDKQPYWPNFNLSDKEQVSNKETMYYVTVINSDNTSSQISVDYDCWVELEVGQEVKVEKWLWMEKIIFE